MEESLADFSEMKNNSKMMWIFLSLFLLFILLIISSFYAYTLSVYVDPATVPSPKGSYAVLAGLKGTTMVGCGTPTGDCQFAAPSLTDAVNRCDLDSMCSNFYYDGATMIYTLETNPQEMKPTSVGGTYLRQVSISST